MTSLKRFRTSYNDSVKGRLKSIYDHGFRDFDELNTLNPLKRSMVFVYLLRAWRGEKSWFTILFWLTWGMFLDGLRLLWLYFLFACSRIVTPKLAKIDTEVNFDTKLYEKFPVEQKIWPNPQCGLDETGDCDGEHLYVSNPVNIYGPMTCWLLIGWSSLFFIDNVAVATLLFLLSPFLTTFIPSSTGVMFHRRAQTATFYRGLFGTPVTVPFKQVSYASTLDPDGGASMLVIRAKVPRKDGSGAYYVRFRSFDTDYLRQRVGAIYAFMDQSNVAAISILAKESIEWHKANNETLWRFTNKKQPPAESAQHYQSENSLYNLTDQLITPHSIRFGEIVNPETRGAGLAEDKRVLETRAEVQAIRAYKSEYEKAKPIIAEFFAAQLDERAPLYNESIVFPLLEKFESEACLSIVGITSSFYSNSHEVFSRIDNEIIQEEKGNAMREAKEIRNCLSFVNRQRASEIKNALNNFNKVKKRLAFSLNKHYPTVENITDIYIKFTSSERLKDGFLADYDWQKYAEDSIAEICTAAKKREKAAVVNN
ncbi:hypothetical protein [Salinibius halmophilus]|uniref:hypothetical protein n=1 Tax=Salinibius halmophilus TaxID=1853216 RepID=UPI000E65F2EF|nr:hypothetical protein [Salinibius halmophilus]